MTQYNKIKFSHSWDKLQDPEFTTIRSWNPGKEQYYRSHIGEKFTVLKVDRYFQTVPGRMICHAWLKGVIVLNPQELPLDLLRRDVSLDGKINQEWLSKLQAMDKGLLLVFTKTPVENQKSLDELPRDPKIRTIEEALN